MSLNRNLRACRVLWIVAFVCLLTGMATTAAARELVGIAVEPVGLVLEPDQTYQYRAFAEFSDNTRIEVTPFVTWRTSTSAVARISNEPESVGILTARGPGDVRVTAIFYYFDDDNRGNAELQVDAGRVVGLRTKPTTKSLEVGRTETFTARLMYESGYDVDITDRVQWSSTAPAIASIGPLQDDGVLVYPHRVGTTTITAYDPETGWRNLDGIARVRARVTHIDFEESEYILGINMRLPVRVYAYRDDGTRTQITDDVRFEVTNAGIAQVAEGNPNPGQITPFRSGSVSVDAFDEERNLRASASLGRATIRVTGSLQNLLINPLSVRIGDSRNARVYGQLSTGATTNEMRRVVEWRSLNPSIASVTNTSSNPGEISGIRAGTTTVIATDPHTGISSTARNNVIVRPSVEPIVSLRTKPTTKSLEVGQQERFSARGVYLSGGDTDISDRVRWSSSDSRIASVVSSGPNAGTVIAHRAGSCTITAYDPETRLANSDGATTVRSAVTHIDFERTSYLLGDNMSLPLRVYAYRDDGTRSQITDDVTFEIQPDRIVEIAEGGDDAGRITALGRGTATVDAVDTKRGLRASDSLGPTSIQVEGSLREIVVEPLAMTVGETRNARVHGLLSTGTVTSDLRRVVQWESLNRSLATVSNASGDRGSVTGLQTGTTSLVATEISTGISSLQTDNLEVRGAIESIEIEPASLRLGVGLRFPLRAYARRADGSRSNITNAVVWSAGDQAAVAIDEAGWVEARSIGQSSIQAFHAPTGINSDNGLPGNVTVAGRVESIEINPLRVAAGSRRKAKVYARLTDGTETDDLRPALEWSVSNPEVARVGSADTTDLDPGEVEGLRAGWTTLVARDPINGWTTRGVRNLKVQGLIRDIMMEAPDRGLVPLGAEARFKVRAIYEDGERLNISDKCEWASDAPEIASVQNQSPAKGVVTGHRVGQSTTIRATCDGLLASFEAVVLGETTGLRFANDRSRFPAYRSYRFRAFAEYENDQVIEVTRDAVWVVTNPAVAALDPEEPGRVNFLDSGTTMLLAAYENGFFAIVELEIYGGVDKIEFTPKKVTIRGGSGRRLRVTGSIPGQRGDIAMTRRVTLESSDEAIVRLAPTETEPGRILTGGTPGTATITATTSAGIQATATVRVRDVLESLEIRPRQTELANNAIGRFQVIGTYQNGKSRYLTRYAEVSTTNPSILQIESSRGSYGKMYAQSTGEVQIRALDPGTGLSSPPVTIRVNRAP